MHPAAFAFVRSFAARRSPGLVLEIGGRRVNGSIRPLFAGDPYLAIDLLDGPDVDIVANGATYIPDVAPACVVCCEVLEHTEDADAICTHVRRILEPRGIFIVTTASPERRPHSAIDGGTIRPGEWYRGITAAELAIWLDGFASAIIVDAPGTQDVYAFARKGER
jgi:hypothetical protein